VPPDRDHGTQPGGSRLTGMLTGWAARRGMPGPKRPGFGLPRSRRMPANVPVALAAATGGR